MEGGRTDQNEGGGKGSVCVTGATGFIGSWLVMRLLQRGYYVHGTVRDPADHGKVKHLLELPKAGTHLSLWRADLKEEGSFDDAIQGCVGVFHVASPMDISVKDAENEMIKPTVNGMLDIMRACTKAKSVKRLIYTSTTGTISTGPQPPPLEFDESFWTDIDYCKAQKMTAWMYYVAKTTAEKVAWEFAKEKGLDLVTIHPPFVIGPFISPSLSVGAKISLALLTGDERSYVLLTRGQAVHVEDLCNAHIYLFEHPEARGRYICSSHCFEITELARSLSNKYPEYNIPAKFEGMDQFPKPVPLSSKKLLDLGYKFQYNSEEYDIGDVCAEAIESCREKGLLPLPADKALYSYFDMNLTLKGSKTKTKTQLILRYRIVTYPKFKRVTDDMLSQNTTIPGAGNNHDNDYGQVFVTAHVAVSRDGRRRE
uniref:NAD-dependent epimerase/dehydratase domain-containing protein n=1 Tax=Vitis vinifera TaxID=29760 RepID=F6H062_VITVI